MLKNIIRQGRSGTGPPADPEPGLFCQSGGDVSVLPGGDTPDDDFH